MITNIMYAYEIIHWDFKNAIKMDRRSNSEYKTIILQIYFQMTIV